MKLIFILGSTWLMVILFVALAFGMGVGTFIENAHSIDAARIYVYNSWWFETLMGLFVINFFLNIKKFGLHLKHKWNQNLKTAYRETAVVVQCDT